MTTSMTTNTMYFVQLSVIPGKMAFLKLEDAKIFAERSSQSAPPGTVTTVVDDSGEIHNAYLGPANI